MTLAAFPLGALAIVSLALLWACLSPSRHRVSASVWVDELMAYLDETARDLAMFDPLPPMVESGTEVCEPCRTSGQHRCERVLCNCKCGEQIPGVGEREVAR